MATPDSPDFTVTSHTPTDTEISLVSSWEKATWPKGTPDSHRLNATLDLANQSNVHATYQSTDRQFLGLHGGKLIAGNEPGRINISYEGSKEPSEYLAVEAIKDEKTKEVTAYRVWYSSAGGGVGFDNDGPNDLIVPKDALQNKALLSALSKIAERKSRQDAAAHNAQIQATDAPPLGVGAPPQGKTQPAQEQPDLVMPKPPGLPVQDQPVHAADAPQLGVGAPPQGKTQPPALPVQEKPTITTMPFDIVVEKRGKELPTETPVVETLPLDIVVERRGKERPTEKPVVTLKNGPTLEETLRKADVSKRRWMYGYNTRLPGQLDELQDPNNDAGITGSKGSDGVYVVNMPKRDSGRIYDPHTQQFVNNNDGRGIDGVLFVENQMPAGTKSLTIKTDAPSVLVRPYAMANNPGGEVTILDQHGNKMDGVRVRLTAKQVQAMIDKPEDNSIDVKDGKTLIKLDGKTTTYNNTVIANISINTDPNNKYESAVSELRIEDTTYLQGDSVKGLKTVVEELKANRKATLETTLPVGKHNGPLEPDPNMPKTPEPEKTPEYNKGDTVAGLYSSGREAFKGNVESKGTLTWSKDGTTQTQDVYIVKNAANGKLYVRNEKGYVYTNIPGAEIKTEEGVVLTTKRDGSLVAQDPVNKIAADKQVQPAEVAQVGGKVYGQGRVRVVNENGKEEWHKVNIRYSNGKYKLEDLQATSLDGSHKLYDHADKGAFIIDSVDNGNVKRTNRAASLDGDGEITMYETVKASEIPALVAYGNLPRAGQDGQSVPYGGKKTGHSGAHR